MEQSVDRRLTMPAAPVGIDTPEKLAAWIDAIPRRQGISSGPGERDADAPVAPFEGRAPEPHVEIYLRRPFLKDDAESCEAETKAAVEALAWEIYTEIAKRPGAVIWRVHPEFETVTHPIFLRYGVDGPDKDYPIDKRGWADHRYAVVAAYARLSVHFTS